MEEKKDKMRKLVSENVFSLRRKTTLIAKSMKQKCKHLILVVLSLVSILLILQIVFGVFPLFESEKTIDETEKINGFVVDCSLGVLTSVLFYYLLVYFPEYKRQLKTRKLFQRDIDFIALYAQIIIAFFVDKYGIPVSDTKLLKIKNEHFKGIDVPTTSTIKFNIRTESYARNYNGSTEIGLIHYLLEEIHKLSCGIMENPLVIFEDVELIEMLTKWKENDLYILMVTLYSVQKHGAKSDLSNVVSTFHSMFRDLSKFTKVKDIEINSAKTSNLPFVYE